MKHDIGLLFLKALFWAAVLWILYFLYDAGVLCLPKFV